MEKTIDDRWKVTVAGIEPNRREFTLNEHDFGKENIDIVSFEVPRTLEKARSAYCYDPVFRTAVDLYASENNQRVEKALSDNLMHALHCRAELLEDSNVGSTNNATSLEGLQGMVDEEEEEEDTVESLRREYVDGDIDIYEFEERVEKVLE